MHGGMSVSVLGAVCRALFKTNGRAYQGGVHYLGRP